MHLCSACSPQPMSPSHPPPFPRLSFAFADGQQAGPFLPAYCLRVRPAIGWDQCPLPFPALQSSDHCQCSAGHSLSAKGGTKCSEKGICAFQTCKPRTVGCSIAAEEEKAMICE